MWNLGLRPCSFFLGVHKSDFLCSVFDRKRNPKKRTGHLRSTETKEEDSHWKRHDRKKVQYYEEDRTRQDRRRLRCGRRTSKETCLIVFNGLFACPLSFTVSPASCLVLCNSAFCSPEKRLSQRDSTEKRSLNMKRQEKEQI
jgi:hypothetical protein